MIATSPFNYEYIHNLCTLSKQDPFDIQKVILFICDHIQLEVETLKSNTRARKVVIVRQMICHILRNNTKLSLAEIGKELKVDALDHATVLYSVKEWENSKAQKGNEYFIEVYNKAKAKFNLQ